MSKKIIVINDNLMFSVNDIAFLEKSKVNFPAYTGPDLNLEFNMFDEMVHIFSKKRTKDIETTLADESNWNLTEVDLIKVGLITGDYFNLYHDEYVFSALPEMRQLVNDLTNLANKLEKLWFGSPYLPKEYYNDIAMFDHYGYYENGLVSEIESYFKLYKD